MCLYNLFCVTPSSKKMFNNSTKISIYVLVFFNFKIIAKYTGKFDTILVKTKYDPG